MRITVVIVIFQLFWLPFVKAQSTLTQGDILFTSYNGVPSAGVAPDTFSFVILTPITAGTIIYFTERGYQGGTTWQASGSTEGTISWTSGTALAIGKEVTIAGIGASAAKVDGSSNGTVAIISGGNVTTGLSLSNAGDQILAFQGGGGNPANGAAVFISGINWALSCGTTTDAGWNGSGCTYGPQSSQLPSGLVGGTSALLMGTAGAAPNNSHGRFNCTGTPISTVAAIKAAILNKANWNFSSSATTTFDIPAGCLYLGSGLPLTWLDVSGSSAFEKNIVIWKVDEQNVSSYEVERSTDGIRYTLIKVINSRGDGENTYQFAESSLSISPCYYRIKQTDFDGKFSYSIVIKLTNKLTGDLSIYPSPAKNTVTIIADKAYINTKASLLNSNGTVMQRFILTQFPFTLDVSPYIQGVYFLKLANGVTQKIVKQ